MVRHVKTGRNQFVPLTDEVLLRRLRRFTSSLLPYCDFLFSLTYASFTSTFHDALRFFHLEDVGYTLHSLRHGGATWEWLNGRLLEYVMLKGRWSSKKSFKHYINAQKALLVRSSLPIVSDPLLRRFASRCRDTAVVEGVERPRARRSPDPLGI